MTDTLWIVRAGPNALWANDFLEQRLVAVGLVDIGPSGLTLGAAEMKRRVTADHPNWKPGKVQSTVSQMRRFVHGMAEGDRVGTYDSDSRTYSLGTITGPATYRPQAIAALPYSRAVDWQQQVLRDALSVEARNTLGAIQTLFSPKAAVAKEVMARAIDLAAEPVEAITAPERPEDVEALDALRAYTIEQSHQLIQDRIAALDPEEVPQLVAGILRAMGYRTRVTPVGRDRGVDVFASPDGLGLEEPRIFVEVKHRQAKSGAPAIRSFLGGRRPGDRCLFVSTGGFSQEARYEAERASIPVTLLNMSDLRGLLLEYYDALDPQAKALVPLQRLYWPVD